MPIVTVSRQMGAGAELIIADVSKLLGLTVIDRTVVGRAALAAGVPQVAFQELAYEGQRTLVQRMIQIMEALPTIPGAPPEEPRRVIGPFTLPFGGVFTSSLPPASEARATMERYVNIVTMLIRDLASQGNVLIVEQGSQAILRDDPRSLHVQIIADFEDRVRRLMERDQYTRSEALRRLRASDEARAQYVRKYYGIDWLDPRNYHMVLNTSKLGIAGAVQAIVTLARYLEQSKSVQSHQEATDGP